MTSSSSLTLTCQSTSEWGHWINWSTNPDHLPLRLIDAPNALSFELDSTMLAFQTLERYLGREESGDAETHSQRKYGRRARDERLNMTIPSSRSALPSCPYKSFYDQSSISLEWRYTVLHRNQVIAPCPNRRQTKVHFSKLISKPSHPFPNLVRRFGRACFEKRVSPCAPHPVSAPFHKSFNPRTKKSCNET